MNYTFTNPYVPLKKDCLVQTAVSFTSREDATQIKKLKTHLYMVLDVSGSMNRADKYPLLRQAIPELIQQMDDDDYLTIILFSNADDLVISKSIRQCRDQIPDLLKRIDSSGVMYGRSTLLTSALRTAIEEIKHFRKENPLFINRLYILTDGQLHDAEDCVRLNGPLRSLESDVASYGFGEDFELDALNRLMEGVPGNTVKHIFNTEDVKQTFSHIGNLAQRIVAGDAEFEFVFAPEVIAGDAFCYQPGTKYYGIVDPRSKTFHTKLPALERDRMYTFCFEGRLLQKGAQENQRVGTASLKFRAGGKSQAVSASISINRTEENWHLSRVSNETQQIFQVLDALRNKDSDVLLKSLRARLAIYSREGADPALVKVVVGAIAKLVAGYSLTEADNRDLLANKASQASGNIEDSLRNLAERWLLAGYPSAWITWLLRKSQELAISDLHSLLQNCSQPMEKEILIKVFREGDPMASFSEAEKAEFTKAIQS
ncbi:MAG: VWA domain-containing protein [Deltaproteobacteria bacterium]|nr:MAG: VWA domain-containing protein [Deltaproteobacteria bacterium]